MLMLLPDTCTIKRPVIIRSDGEDSKSYTTIYDNIKCRYYQWKIKLQNDDLSQQTELWTYKVILEKDKTIYRKDLLELNSEDYIVEDVRIMKLSVSHHLELIIKRL